LKSSPFIDVPIVCIAITFFWLIAPTTVTLLPRSKWFYIVDSFSLLTSSYMPIGDKLRRAIARQEGLSQQAQTCETQTGEVI
jgi:hypothetical protein